MTGRVSWRSVTRMAEPRPYGRRSRWALAVRTHPTALDVGFAIAVAGLALLAPSLGQHPRISGVTGPDAFGAAASFGLLLFRRRWPVMILALSVIGAVTVIAVTMENNALVAVAIIMVFTVASQTDRRTAWIAGIATALALFTSGVIAAGASWVAPEYVGVIAWTGMATAVGDALRSRRAYVAAVEERARRAEQSREEEAHRQVIEERLRIAHELHDVLAHHIAVINVQAGVATHVLRDSPAQAEQALGHVRRASQSVLDELSALLNVLRESGTAPTEPAPGLDRLPQLLDTFAAAGLRVSPVVTGPTRTLPATVDLTAYRIVQEALTNVHKHGRGARADLRLEYTPDQLRIAVANGGAHTGDNRIGRAEPGTGHGIIGMRERAMSVGGWATAGPRTGGGFQVDASLPLAPAGRDQA